MRSSVVTKWVDLDSMNGLGLTSGVKKVCPVSSHSRQRFYAAYDILIQMEALLCVSSCLSDSRIFHEKRSICCTVVNNFFVQLKLEALVTRNVEQLLEFDASFAVCLRSTRCSVHCERSS